MDPDRSAGLPIRLNESSVRNLIGQTKSEFLLFTLGQLFQVSFSQIGLEQTTGWVEVVRRLASLGHTEIDGWSLWVQFII